MKSAQLVQHNLFDLLQLFKMSARQIFSENGLVVFYMQRFLIEKYFQANFSISAFFLFQVDKISKVDSIPDEYSGRKRRVVYLSKIFFPIPLLY